MLEMYLGGNMIEGYKKYNLLIMSPVQIMCPGGMPPATFLSAKLLRGTPPPHGKRNDTYKEKQENASTARHK